MKNFIQKSSIIQESGTGTVTIAAPGAGRYNAFTNVVVETDAAGDLTITGLKGGITKTVGVAAGGGYDANYDEFNALLGAENTAVAFAFSAGNYNIFVRGFVTP